MGICFTVTVAGMSHDVSYPTRMEERGRPEEEVLELPAVSGVAGSAASGVAVLALL